MKILITITIYLIVFAGISYGVEPVQPKNNDKPDSAVKWYSESQLANPAIAEPNFIDTTLKGFHKYDFSYRKYQFFAHKGIAGHATRNLVFNPVSQGHGFSYLKSDIYKGYAFSHEILRFYRPEYVFTDLFYLTGGEREQMFYALHSQRLSDNLVMSFKYQLVRAPSIYSRVQSYNANFHGALDYVSENERYQALGSFVWNRMNNQESGGLRNHEGFEQDEARDSVWLFNAEGRYRETTINIHQYYQLGIPRDEGGEENDKNNSFINLGRIYLNSSYNRRSYIFDESVPPHAYFPGHPHIDSLQTFDSTMVHNISNKIGWANYRFGEQSGSGFPLFFNIYLKHDYFTIHHPYGFDKDEFNQFTPGVDLHTDNRKLISFNGFFNYTIGGYNNSDLSAGVGGRYGIAGEDKNRFELNLSYHEHEAPFLMNNFFSNYVLWNNNFDKTQITNAGVKFINPYFVIDLNAFRLENWQYFNNAALPQQADKSFLVTSAGLKSSLSFGVFKFDNHIVYQYLSDDNYEQFPALVSYHSIYAGLVLFNKALYAHIGIDASYNSPYYAQSYMPVYKQFYVQDDYKTPDYIFLDVFVNLKISRARLFVKWQNLGATLWGQQPIYTIPFYPLLESQIRFGVSWMFYN